MLDSLDAAGGFPCACPTQGSPPGWSRKGCSCVSAGPSRYARGVRPGPGAVVQECERGRSTARFRDLVGTGRRDAQLLLERLDADGVTLRRGDVRVLRRSVAARR